MWYQFAKTAAEEAATNFLTENNINYVVLKPTATIGPLLQPELNESSAFIFHLINGTKLLFGRNTFTSSFHTLSLFDVGLEFFPI